MRAWMLLLPILLVLSACSDSPAYKQGHDDGWIIGIADGGDGGPRDRDKALQLAKKHANGDSDYERGYHEGYNVGYDEGCQ